MTILLAVSRYPWPLRSGDQRRTVEMVAALAQLGEVVVLAPVPPAGAPGPPVDWPARLELYRSPPVWTRPARAMAAFFSGAPLESTWLGGADLEGRFRALVTGADLAIVQLSRLAPLLAAVPEGLPLAVDLIDSLALNLERRAALAPSGESLPFRLGAARHRRAEERLLRRADVAFLVAEGDRAAVAARVAPELGRRLAVVPLVAPEGGGRAPGGTRPRLVVTGNLGYFPTRHGITLLLRDVWPELAAARPEIDLVLAGARPPRSLARLARRAGATLVADPPDLRSHLAAATVALAPLEAGTGLPIKILEAWAEGVPVVASPAAAAGVGGRDGVDLRVAATPADWLRVVGELLDVPALRARLAAGGRSRLAADFAPAAVAAGFHRALRPLLSARRRPSSSG